jgi:LPS export ABC transporter protein LptC
MRLFLIATAAVLVCAGCEDKVRPSVLHDVEADIPTQESWNSTVIFSDSARTKAVLWAGHIASYAQQQYTLLSDSLRVDFYNEEEEHTSVLTASKGKVDDRTQDFAAYFHVVVTSDSGTVLMTDSLFWTNATRQIHTDAFVEIISPTEHINGHGLVSDQGLKNYKITRVTGKAITKD